MTRQEAIADVLMMYTGLLPPFPIKVERVSELSEDKYEELQRWLVYYGKLQWLPGINMMEAIDDFVDGAIENSEREFLENMPALHDPKVELLRLKQPKKRREHLK